MKIYYVKIQHIGTEYIYILPIYAANKKAARFKALKYGDCDNVLLRG